MLDTRRHTDEWPPEARRSRRRIHAGRVQTEAGARNEGDVPSPGLVQRDVDEAVVGLREIEARRERDGEPTGAEPQRSRDLTGRMVVERRVVRPGHNSPAG